MKICTMYKPRRIVAAFVVATVALSCGAAHAATIVIDSFITPDPEAVYAVNMLHAGPVVIDKHFGPGILGGERDFLLEVNGMLQMNSYTGTTGEGLLVYGAGPNSGSQLVLQYDGIDGVGGDTATMSAPMGTTLINTQGLNIDLTDSGTNDRFRFEFMSADAGPDMGTFPLSISLYSPAGVATFDGLVSELYTPFDYEVLFSEFLASPDFTFADVTSIDIAFNSTGQVAVDFELARISVVPEPATLIPAILAGLFFGMVKVRRASRSLPA